MSNLMELEKLPFQMDQTAEGRLCDYTCSYTA